MDVVQLVRQGLGNLRPAWKLNVAHITFFVTQERTQRRVKTKLRYKQIFKAVSQKKHLPLLLIVFCRYFS